MKHFTDLLTRIPNQQNRYFHAIKAGKYRLSIQASEGHYCTPRKTMKSAKDYVSFEVLIDNPRGKSIYPHRSMVIKAFPNFKELGARDIVLGWIGEDLLQELYEYLSNYHIK